jgi:hypothetical protein
MRHQVGFVDPREAFNRGAIESHSLLECLSQFTGWNGETFDMTEDVGKPESYDFDTPIVNFPQNSFSVKRHGDYLSD